MKAIYLTSALLLLSAVGETKPKGPGIVVITKRYDLFYFKVKREFRGGTVEVFNINHERIAAQVLDKRRMIIDFYDAPPGQYTIKIEHNGKRLEYSYSNAYQSNFLSVSATASK